MRDVVDTKNGTNGSDSRVYYISSIFVMLFATSRYIIPAVIIMSSFFIFLLQYKKVNIPTIAFAFIFIAIVSLLQGLFQISPYTSIPAGIREFYRCMIYFVVVLVFSNIKLTFKDYSMFWMIVLIALVLVQILQLIKLTQINIILGKLYGEESKQLDVSTKYGVDQFALFRAGSIFINPNQYFKVLLLVTCIYLFKGTFFGKLAPNIFKFSSISYFFILVISLVLTGSRTAFTIFSAMWVYFNFRKITLKKVLILFMFLLAIIVFFSRLDLSAFRMLKIVEGIGNSLSAKFGNFTLIFAGSNVIEGLLGFGPFTEFQSGITTLDFDLGYMYAYYGIIGLLFYIVVYWEIIKNSKKSDKYLKVGFILVLIISGLTSGVFFNIRVFSTILAISFVKLDYSNYEMRNE